MRLKKLECEGMVSISQKYRLFFLLVVILYLLTRLFNLSLLPIFMDETNYIYWAKGVAASNAHWFVSLSAGKPFPLIWFMVLFIKILPSDAYLLAGRLPSVVFGLMTLLGTYKLASFIFESKRVGYLAAFLYVLVPFTLFHDRMAIYDSMLSAMMIWAGFFVFKTARSFKLRDATLWGIFLGSALLAKASALSYVLLTPIAFTFLTLRKISGGDFQRVLKLVLVAFVVSQLVANVQVASRGYGEYLVKSVDYTPGERILATLTTVFFPNLQLTWQWLRAYFTAPLLLTGFASYAYVLLGRNFRVGLSLLLLTIAPWLAFSLLGQIYFPRYLLFTAPLFLVVTANFLVKILHLSRHAFLLFSICLLFPLMHFDFLLLTDPSKAPFPEIDHRQYVANSPSGYGLAAVFEALDAELQKNEVTLVVQSDYYGQLLNATNLEFFDNDQLTIIRQWPNLDDQEKIISLARKKTIFVLTEDYLIPTYRDFFGRLAASEIKFGEKPGGKDSVYLLKSGI